jgi:hypothetical protein
MPGGRDERDEEALVARLLAEAGVAPFVADSLVEEPGYSLLVGDDGRAVAVPWPQPPPKDDRGRWVPAILERYEDGSALALWRWTEGMRDEQ